MNDLLIVFCKNPELGKVKTRLAINIGEEKALSVYLKLLEHTHSVAQKSYSQYAVYYSDYINENDLWEGAVFKALQTGEDIGERMSNAIASGLMRGYDSVILIGADIYELRSEIIDQAFKKLKTSDIVLGPAKDGGYYLIGMKESFPALFNLTEWSTPEVLSETLDRIDEKNLKYSLLDQLNDIDVLDDLKETDLMAVISASLDRE